MSPEQPHEPDLSQQQQPSRPTTTPPSPGSPEPAASGSPARTRPAAERWAADFTAAHGREPTLSEYQSALAAGEIARHRDASVQQMADGAKQVYTGARTYFDERLAPRAKEFYDQKVAPAARTAADSVQQAAQPGDTASPLATWMRRAPVIAPIAAVVAILSLFMPIASALGFSVNFFSDEADGEGGVLLFFLLAALAASIAAGVKQSRTTRVAAGVAVGVAGFAAALDGLANLVSVGGEDGVSVGFGLLLLTLAGLAMLGSGVLMLLSLRRPQR